jgi:ribosome-associated toxin RatA of RatAB toxin-antitoxin module
VHHISKSAIVPYSAQQMYQLVNQVDDYAQFLNWCASSSILKQTENEITASVKINKGIFTQSFTTINSLTLNEKIHMKLQDGPFSMLEGDWIFTPLRSDACKVSLILDFGFSSKILDLTIAPIFSNIANSQLDAFVERAKFLYG